MPQTEPPPRKRKSRQAVILLHGIGEQVPMATLRGFVGAVWVSNADVIDATRPDGETGETPRKRNPVWNKPDERNHSYELHRITTETARDGQRTDFFEYYWAHLMHGTTLDQVLAWLRSLLLRSPRRVPAAVRYAWFFAWFVVLAVLAAFAVVWTKYDAVWAAGLAAGIAFLAPLAGKVWPSMQKLLISHVGDVVRYVEARPPNVARRQEIRERGVALLERLMGVNEASLAANRQRIRDGQKLEWDTPYDRIVLVGHSLGTIVAYDIIKHAFARVNTLVELSEPKPAMAALEEYCRAGLADPGKFAPEHFQTLQSAAARELVDQGSPWIVADFISIGSPLTHADFLMADDADDLVRQQEARILPTCPPALDWDRHSGQQHLAYPSPFWPKEGDADFKLTDGYRGRVPHHAAQFAFTRWTNIHSPHSWIVLGDIVSGPVARMFGLRNRQRPAADPLPGARDQAVPRARSFWRRFLTHTRYWTVPDAERRLDAGEVPDAVQILRAALWRQGE